MSEINCLLLKPVVKSAESHRRQEQDIKTLLRVIKAVGLTLPINHSQGTPVKEITPELIELVHQAEIAVVDANYYESEETFPLSPGLFYLIALRHSLTNKTILATRSVSHLPQALIRHHTLTYPEDRLEFVDEFERVVEAIRSGNDGRPDNLIQEYREKMEKEEELRRYKEENYELKRYREEKRSSSTIQFRRIN